MITLQWSHIFWISGLFLAWNGFLLAIIKWLSARVIAGIDAKLDALAQSACGPEKCEELKRVAREFHQSRVDLPVMYVRRDDAFRENAVLLARVDALANAQHRFVLREDHIRSETVMHAKLDAMAERLERLMEVAVK